VSELLPSQHETAHVHGNPKELETYQAKIVTDTSLRMLTNGLTSVRRLYRASPPILASKSKQKAGISKSCNDFPGSAGNGQVVIDYRQACMETYGIPKLEFAPRTAGPRKIFGNSRRVS
jgi:hypothetical protein